MTEPRITISKAELIEALRPENIKDVQYFPEFIMGCEAQHKETLEKIDELFEKAARPIQTEPTTYTASSGASIVWVCVLCSRRTLHATWMRSHPVCKQCAEIEK